MLVWIFADEATMLNAGFLQNIDKHGGVMRVAYFCTRNIFVRGHNKLYPLRDSDFEFGSDQFRKFVR